MAERIARLAKDRRRLWPGALYFFLSMLLSSAGEGLSPLGIAFMGGISLAKGDPLPAFLGAILGSLFLRRYAAALTLLFFGLLLLVFGLSKKELRAMDKLLLLCASELLCFPLFFSDSYERLMEGLSLLAFSVLGAVLFQRGLKALRLLFHRRWPKEQEQFCLCACVGMLLFSLGGIRLGTLDLSAIFAAFFSILLIRTKGITAVAAAVMLGAAAILGGAELLFLACLGVCTLAGCILREMGKWGIGCGFGASALLITYALSPNSPGAPEAALGAFLYLLFPASLFQLPPEGRVDPKHIAALRECRRLRRELTAVAEVLETTSPLFADPEGFSQRQILAISGILRRLSLPPTRKPRLYGMKVGAASCPKGGSEQNGDSMGMQEREDQLLLLLSDGMGSGEAAHAESAAAVSLMGDLLGVGFALEEALACMNRLLIQKSQGPDMFATLDAMVLDLSNGEARFIKFGAPPSFILREGKVYALHGEALPAGILAEARPALHAVFLKRKDRVILMSDGVTDALGRELPAKILERIDGEEDMDQAARSLLSEARKRSDADDMSVIVAKVS